MDYMSVTIVQKKSDLHLSSENSYIDFIECLKIDVLRLKINTPKN